MAPALLILLLLAGCAPGPGDKADRLAQVICQASADELGPAEMQECLERNRRMFLDFQEERLD